MDIQQLEDYIRVLLERQPELGEHYVRRQIEWAQAEIECLDAAQGGARTARSEARTERSAAGAFSTVCVSSKFSSGGVVAPQIGLIRETHAGKSHR